MKHPSARSITSRRALSAGLAALLLGTAPHAASAPAGMQDPWAPFVEPGFPFIPSTVDARNLGTGFSPGNLTARGLVLLLGNNTYATFDPDLLRMSVGWHGSFLELTTMAQVSYQQPFFKNNQIPRVLGRPIFTNGVYPGWTGESPDFRDPRPLGPNPEDPGRGPLSRDLARWKGVHVVGSQAVLEYSVLGTDVLELPSSVKVGDQVGIVRAFRTGPVARPLTLVLAEVPGGRAVPSGEGTISLASAGDTVTVAALAGSGASLRVTGDRYLTLHLPAGPRPAEFRVVTWRGPAAGRAVAGRLLAASPAGVPDVARGGPAHWPQTVTTRGTLSPDTAAYVLDYVGLPTKNPWRRNVRVADVDFFRDGRAAVVTFDGDVWLLAGLSGDLASVRWRRFASGLYEPLSLAVVEDSVYVYGREGIVRLHDRNGDGEADFYESFSNQVLQSIESREYPLGMVAKPGGGFYIAKGGALNNGPRTAPMTFPGFRAGSAHSGTVVEVSPDGSARVFASGLREPFPGIHPRLGIVTASDQQGNFVPSTPVYLVERGGYYGVPATAHRADVPETGRPPLVWIPHAVDRSGAGQVWVTGGRMGFEGDALLHISYGRPGIFRVYVDSTSRGVQGALVDVKSGFATAFMKGRESPADGQLYLAGFKIWDSNATEVSALGRLRYTGQPSLLPSKVEAGRQGVLLRFSTPLDPATAADAARYSAQRWNYRRSSAYGSGNFLLSGEPGRETLPVASAHLSPDAKSLLLVLPDMREADQLQLAYTVRGAQGRTATDTLYLTLNQVEPLDLAAAGFGAVDWETSARRATEAAAAAAAATPKVAASAAQGQQVFQRVGCAGCHSVDGSTQGRMGPTVRGIFGARRTFTSGASAVADEAYLRESIREPAKHIVLGYQEGMPSFVGILSDAEIDSVVEYIKSLGGPAGR